MLSVKIKSIHSYLRDKKIRLIKSTSEPAYVTRNHIPTFITLSGVIFCLASLNCFALKLLLWNVDWILQPDSRKCWPLCPKERVAWSKKKKFIQFLRGHSLTCFWWPHILHFTIIIFSFIWAPSTFHGRFDLIQWEIWSKNIQVSILSSFLHRGEIKGSI